MKKYAFIFHGGWPKPEEAEDYIKKWGSWIGSISQGKQIPGERFQPTGKIASGTNGDKISDIPIGNDTVGAYLIVEANSYEEAVALTKGCPIFENGGTTEVRGIMSM